MSDPGNPSGLIEDVPLWRLLDSELADIYIGSEKTRWPLPERLLTHQSAVLASAFGSDGESSKNVSKTSQKGKNSYTLPDEENETFKILVEYLYSSKIHAPTSEKPIGPLLDLYLLGLKLKMTKLTTDIVDNIREWYRVSKTYPDLRRVQYIYANTDGDNEMREMVVSAVARQLTLGEKIPAHWAIALQRNGQLAVDIIRAIQQWNIEEKDIPDARDRSSDRDRKAKGGFSAVERAGDSVETMASGMVDSAIGLESRDEDAEETKYNIGDDNKVESDDNLQNLKEVAAEAKTITDLKSILVSPMAIMPASITPPPKLLHSEQRQRKKHTDFLLGQDQRSRPSPANEENETTEAQSTSRGKVMSMAKTMQHRKDIAFLVVLWIIYILVILKQSLFPQLDTNRT